MTTKQQHVSRFLEASLLRQAEGKLKNGQNPWNEIRSSDPDFHLKKNLQT